MQRRQFFKISAGVAFSLTSIPMTAIAAGSSDVRSNVLVLGGGMAGLCAAISAKQSGASKVILVEKGGFLGGHSILSGSGYWIGGTKIQKKAGIDDSLEINWQDSLERGLKLNRFLKRDTGVARLVYEQGPKDLDWLESLGVKFTDQPAQAIGNRKRVHYFAPGYRVGSPQAIKALQAKAESLGVEIILNTKLVSLITESEKRNARVIGAIVENNKRNKYAIYADHGVILATGGFANGKEMVEKYHPYLKGVKSHGSKLNVGEGIKAATALGANVIVEHYGFGMNMLFVGTYCSKKVVTCVERKESYCCYNSPLARILQEQGRPQLGKGWGSAQHPQCEGFTQDELERLDFDAMDLSEFEALIVQKNELDSAAAQDRGTAHTKNLVDKNLGAYVPPSVGSSHVVDPNFTGTATPNRPSSSKAPSKNLKN